MTQKEYEQLCNTVAEGKWTAEHCFFFFLFLCVPHFSVIVKHFEIFQSAISIPIIIIIKKKWTVTVAQKMNNTVTLLQKKKEQQHNTDSEGSSEQ